MRKRWRTLMIAGLSCAASQAADLDAGKAVAQAKCAQCHAASDWEGEDAVSLESLMRDMLTNKVKHSKAKIELTIAEIANVAAYWGSDAKGKKAKQDTSSNRLR